MEAPKVIARGKEMVLSNRIPSPHSASIPMSKGIFDLA